LIFCDICEYLHYKSTDTECMSQVAAANDLSLDESPGTLAGDQSCSVTETNKDSSSRISTATPSPVSCYSEKRALGRRFSCTSASNRQVL
jgi:hypothetical protein